MNLNLKNKLEDRYLTNYYSRYLKLKTSRIKGKKLFCNTQPEHKVVQNDVTKKKDVESDENGVNKKKDAERDESGVTKKKDVESEETKKKDAESDESDLTKKKDAENTLK